ncbi:TraB/GumN family protein [Alkalicoccus chagannorensis]|uniref:TraB/GumN family protein n=1 Tax=Alkalicoccus chagannorensis TaxID=427072 RepID=UPI0003F96D32|nr:TraB/GumN family protein [Alkalicoccus chagannorensis]
MKKSILYLTPILLLGACQQEELSFADDALERAVLEQSGASSLQEVDPEDITALSSDEEIVSLSGIDQLTNLEELDLPEATPTEIRDLLTVESLESADLGIILLDPTYEESLVQPMLELESSDVEVYAQTMLPEVNPNGASNGLLYEISSEANTVYLYGSVHVGEPDMYPLRDEVMEAYERSDEAAFEVNINDPQVQQDMNEELMSAMAGGGRELADEMHEDAYETLVDELETFGIQEPMMAQAEPWALSLFTGDIALMRSSFEAAYGIDPYFLDLAEEDGLPVRSLENLEDQLEAMQNTSYEEQVAALEDEIASLDRADEQMRALVGIWREGDQELFSFLRSVDTAHDTLGLDQRDEQMSEQLASFLEEEEGTLFAVVGALHTAGEGSIPQLMEEAGYDVQFHPPASEEENNNDE